MQISDIYDNLPTLEKVAQHIEGAVQSATSLSERNRLVQIALYHAVCNCISAYKVHDDRNEKRLVDIIAKYPQFDANSPVHPGSLLFYSVAEPILCLGPKALGPFNILLECGADPEAINPYILPQTHRHKAQQSYTGNLADFLTCQSVNNMRLENDGDETPKNENIARSIAYARARAAGYILRLSDRGLPRVSSPALVS